MMSVIEWTIPVHDREKLIRAAIEAKKFSYSPYSQFRVGAALLTTDGRIIKGANVENSSYGGTICAERTVIVKAVSDGMRTFVGLAVTSDLYTPIAPCGLCRQVIREFCRSEMPIFLVPTDYPQPQPPPDGTTEPNGEGVANGEGGVMETTIKDLLPYGFGPAHLASPRAVDS